LKRQVEKMRPKTEEELDEIVQDCWERIPQAYIDSCIMHVKNTICPEVIEKKGEWSRSRNLPKEIKRKVDL